MRRVYALLLAAAMVVAAGCGGAPSGSGGLDDGKTIKIGFIGPISGDVKSYGVSAFNGFELALEQAGYKAGDFTIEYVKDDDRGRPEEGTNLAIKQITQDGVKAIVGSVTSDVTKAVSEIANQHGVVMITGTATADTVTVDDQGKRKPFVFRTCFLDSTQGKVAAKFALEELGKKTAAILYDKGNPYTVGLAEAFKSAFVAGGGQIVAEESYGRDDTDFSAIVTKVATANPEVLYLPDYYNKVSLIGQAVRAKGLDVVLLGADGWDSTDLDFQIMDGGYFTAHYSPTEPREAVQKFVQAYREKYGSDPDSFAALVYDATNMLLEAIRQAGTDDPDKIREALQNLKDFPAVGGDLSFDANGNPVKDVTIQKVNKDGTFEFVTKITP